ncbi:MAG: hypothetical protein GY769_11415 [bacterium]|nr:hypothetical protein [bacterium]
MNTRARSLATVVAFLSLTVAVAEASEVSGYVREQGTLAPIPGAIVSLQAADTRTTSQGDGSYSFDVGTGMNLVIVGAQKGYYNESIVVTPPASGQDILLETVPQDDDPSYSLVDPRACQRCHPHQYAEWVGTPMANAGENTWVRDIYNGSGTAGGDGGFVYTRDSVHRDNVPDSERASCHQPTLWIGNGLSGDLDDTLDSEPMAVAHGVSCDVCHKIADIDESKKSFPGIHPDAVTFTRPAGPEFNQVQYGVRPDVDYVSPSAMRASHQPQLVAAVCGACHQDKNDPDEDGDFEEDDGVISEPTYLEWLNSPYGDERSSRYTTCVDCHMPSLGDRQVCDVLDPPLERDPDTIRSHFIEGTTAPFLENAAELTMRTEFVGDSIEVEVGVTNSLTGHHVPTGVTVRNMILLVQAWRAGNDPFLNPLPHTGSETIHELGGIGDPTRGYYAGLPGKLYAKVNRDGSGNSPTFFTDATGIVFDNRIPALATDTTNYTFAVTPGEGAIHVRARLIYRRAFRFLVDAKNWTEDGHGNPLEDVLPPYYGHLMESATTANLVGHRFSLSKYGGNPRAGRLYKIVIKANSDGSETDYPSGFPLPTDPATNGGSVTVSRDGGTLSDPLTAGSWKGLGNPPGSKGWKYENTSAPSGGAVKKALFKSRVIKVVAKGTGSMPVPTASNGRIDTTIVADDQKYCAEADPPHFKELAGRLIESRSSMETLGPAACASPGGAFLEVTYGPLD